MKNINLVPKYYYNKRTMKIYIRRIEAMMASIFLFSILFVLALSYTINIEEQRLYALNVLIEDARFTKSDAIAKYITSKHNDMLLSQSILSLFEAGMERESIIDIIVENIFYTMELIEIAYIREDRRVVLVTQINDRNIIPIFIDALNDTEMFSRINILTANHVDDITIFSTEMFIMYDSEVTYYEL